MFFIQRPYKPHAVIGDSAIQFGYSVQIHMALTIDRFSGVVASFDNGWENDYRTIEFTLALTREEMITVDELLSPSVGVSDDMFFMGTVDSGFFAAGPDMYGLGSYDQQPNTYTATLLDRGYSAMKINPWDKYDCKISALLHGLPMPPPPAHIESNMDFGIGNVRGLRDPEITPKQEWAVSRAVTLGGKNFDVWWLNDEHTTTLKITGTTKSMAAIISELQRERGNTFILRGGDNFWPFGGARSVNPHEWPVRLLDNTITVVHSDVDEWTTTLQLWDAEAARG